MTFLQSLCNRLITFQAPASTQTELPQTENLYLAFVLCRGQTMLLEIKASSTTPTSIFVHKT